MFFKKKSAETGTQAPPSQPPPVASAPAPAAKPPAPAAMPPLVSPAKANGAAQRAAPAPLDAEEAKKCAAAAKRTAAAYGEIVSILSASQAEMNHSLRDLEWLVAPAVRLGQFALAEAQSKTTGHVAPVGAILWAVVSPEADKRLEQQAPGTLRLTPAEWRSGDIPWIIIAAGDRNIVGGLLQQLLKTVFKDRKPKMRITGPDGKVAIGLVEVKEKVS